MKRIIEQFKLYEGCICESRGASGGMATIWNQSTWTCVSNVINQYWIKINLENKADNKKTAIYNIYAPNHFRDRAMLDLSQNIYRG